MASKYDAILDQVVADIQGLALDGITSSNIVKMKVSTERLVKDVAALPAIVVSPFGTKITNFLDGAIGSRDVWYPVAIFTLQISNQDQSTDIDRSLLWHESILNKFEGVRLESVTNAWAEVDPSETFDANAYFRGLDASGMIVRFMNREVRT